MQNTYVIEHKHFLFTLIPLMGRDGAISLIVILSVVVLVTALL